MENKLVNLLKSLIIPYSTENEMQNSIEKFFKNKKIEYKREYLLSKKDKVDFLVYDNIAIECKVKGPAMRVFRQCERYCKYEKIKSLILITSFHMNLPYKINNKNTYIIKPGVNWL